MAIEEAVYSVLRNKEVLGLISSISRYLDARSEYIHTTIKATEEHNKTIREAIEKGLTMSVPFGFGGGEGGGGGTPLQ